MEAASLCGRILRVARRARATDALLVRAQIALVHDLRTGERFHRLGFASLRDATREMVGLEGRTVRERVTLERIFTACPAAETAFLAGRLSQCQVLALGRVLRTRGVDTEAWIAHAQGMSVRAIRERVRAWNGGLLQEDEREGTEVGFEIPTTLTMAWEQGLEEARCALGEAAPVWRCMEAVLAETGFAGAGEEGAVPAVAKKNAGSTAMGMDEAWTPPTAAEPAHDGGSDPAVTDLEPSDPAIPPIEGPACEPIPLQLVPAELARRVRGDLARFERHQRDVRELLDRQTPRDAFDALARLQAIERLRAPQKVLLARLVRDLRDLRAARILGYTTLAELLMGELGLAERTAGRLIESATVFEDAPLLEREAGGGSLSLGKALLVHRLGWGSRLPLHVARARTLTHRAFEEEVRFLRLLRRCAPHLGARFPGPLPQPGLEEALIREIQLWSPKPVTREEIVEDLEQRFGALGPKASQDPAENPVVLARLRALLERFVLRVWEDGEPLDRPTSATLGRAIRVRFWAPWPVAEDFRAAIRQIRRASVHDNPGIHRQGGTERPPGPSPPLSIVQTHAVQPLPPMGLPPGPTRLRPPSPLPMAEWQAALLLVGSAARIWEAQQDPKAKRTVRARILSRDRRRCVAPGCTRRTMLEIHHGIFRSNGGDNTATNLTSLCHGHHQHVLHQGYARLRGHAPQSLSWELGRRPGRPALLRTRGERVVEGATE